MVTGFIPTLRNLLRICSQGKINIQLHQMTAPRLKQNDHWNSANYIVRLVQTRRLTSKMTTGKEKIDILLCTEQQYISSAIDRVFVIHNLEQTPPLFFLSSFFFFFFFPWFLHFTFSLMNMKIPKTLELCKTSKIVSSCTNKQLVPLLLWGAQQARGSGTGSRLVTGPPETFKDAKRQDNRAIMGLDFTILGTIANCLPALLS